MSARSKTRFERGPSAGPLPSRPVSPRGVHALPGGRGHALSLSLQQPDGRHRSVLVRSRVARWIRAALDRPAEITVRIVDELEGHALNHDFRKQDHATNVLTFDYQREPAIVADLVLCAPVIEREARAQNKTLEAHYAHLIVHGTLHAQGWEHGRATDAKKMEARETELLTALGYADPYRP
jgi:probable rRNA maturation factor